MRPPKFTFKGGINLDGPSRQYIPALFGLMLHRWRDLPPAAHPQHAAEAIWRVHLDFTGNMAMYMLRHRLNIPTAVQGLDHGAKAP